MSAVYEAINKVMKELSKEGIKKEQENTHQKYKFRGIDDVYNALASKLADNKLSILPTVKKREAVERSGQRGGFLSHVVLHIDYKIVCSEDGSSHTISVVGEAIDTSDKATNKAMSAAFKYACIQVFCIPTEGDDADSVTHEVASYYPAESFNKHFATWEKLILSGAKTKEGVINTLKSKGQLSKEQLKLINQIGSNNETN